MDTANFSVRMSQAPDEELIGIISSDGFLPEAVEAARAELKRRNLQPDELARMNADVDQLKRLDERRPDVPLSAPAKIAFFIFGCVWICSIPAAVVLKTRGYDRKGSQAFKLILASLAFWISLGVIFSMLRTN